MSKKRDWDKVGEVAAKIKELGLRQRRGREVRYKRLYYRDTRYLPGCNYS